MNILVEGIERVRVGGMNMDSVSRYFELLQENIRKIEEFNGKPATGRHLSNLDESGTLVRYLSKFSVKLRQ